MPGRGRSTRRPRPGRSTSARRGREGLALGRFGLAVWGGLALGPLIGSLLRAGVGYGAVWTLAAVLPLAARATWPARPSRRRSCTPIPSRTRWCPRATWIPGTALLLGNVGYGALRRIRRAVPRLEGHRRRRRRLYLLRGGGRAQPARCSAHLPDRIGPRRGGMLAGAARGARLRRDRLSGRSPSAIVGAAIVGVGFSLLFPALALLVVNAVPEDARGAAMGAFSAFFDAGVGIGAPLAGTDRDALRLQRGFRDGRRRVGARRADHRRLRLLGAALAAHAVELWTMCSRRAAGAGRCAPGAAAASAPFAVRRLVWNERQSRCAIRFRRALRLSSASSTYQGLSGVSV